MDNGFDERVDQLVGSGTGLVGSDAAPQSSLTATPSTAVVVAAPPAPVPVMASAAVASAGAVTTPSSGSGPGIPGATPLAWAVLAAVRG